MYFQISEEVTNILYMIIAIFPFFIATWEKLQTQGPNPPDPLSCFPDAGSSPQATEKGCA